MLTSTLIATLAPMLTLLPVATIVFTPRRKREPVAIRIDGRRYRNARGTIEHAQVGSQASQSHASDR
jgi:hypothetical protein